MIPELLRQVARFVIVGALNTGITYAVYLLVLPALDYSAAYAVSYVIGIGIAYFLNARFVFKVNASWRTLVLFPLVYVVQYLFGWAVLSLAIEKFAISREFALLFSIALSIPLTFLLSRKILTRLA